MDMDMDLDEMTAVIDQRVAAHLKSLPASGYDQGTYDMPLLPDLESSATQAVLPGDPQMTDMAHDGMMTIELPCVLPQQVLKLCWFSIARTPGGPRVVAVCYNPATACAIAVVANRVWPTGSVVMRAASECNIVVNPVPTIRWKDIWSKTRDISSTELEAFFAKLKGTPEEA